MVKAFWQLPPAYEYKIHAIARIQATNPTALSKSVSETLRINSALRLRANFFLTLVVSSSLQLWVCKLVRRFGQCLDVDVGGSSSRYNGVISGLAVPDRLAPFKPLRGLVGGGGRLKKVGPLSSSASVPLSLGDEDCFRLFRWSASKYVGLGSAIKG